MCHTIYVTVKCVALLQDTAFSSCCKVGNVDLPWEDSQIVG